MIKIPLHILGYFFRAVGSGASPLVFIGFALWIFDAFLSKMDIGTLRIVSSVFSLDLESYTGLGIFMLFFVAFVIGLPILPKGKKIGDYISPGRLVSMFAGNKFRNSPLVEIIVHTVDLGDGKIGNVYEKGFLDITRQEVEKLDGSKEELISFQVFLPSANNPTSGRLLRVDAANIEYILDNSTGQFILHIITFGMGGNKWNRREFNPQAREFMAHDPDKPPEKLPKKNK